MWRNWCKLQYFGANLKFDAILFGANLKLDAILFGANLTLFYQFNSDLPPNQKQKIVFSNFVNVARIFIKFYQVFLVLEYEMYYLYKDKIYLFWVASVKWDKRH